MTVTTGGPGLELEPAFGDAAAFRGLLFCILHEAGGLDSGELAGQHVVDLFAALQRLQVPGEGHEIAPVTIGLKQVDGGVYVAGFKRIAELRKNRIDFGGGTDIKHIHLLHGAWSDGGAAVSPPRKPIPAPAGLLFPAGAGEKPISKDRSGFSDACRRGRAGHRSPRSRPYPA